MSMGRRGSRLREPKQANKLMSMTEGGREIRRRVGDEVFSTAVA